ncbi:MAG: ATP-binding cassette domain-containing protein [Clostridia bacterium]|nr:ATP-binding cassette domain-containing protein [Clostridia bacterium]
MADIVLRGIRKVYEERPVFEGLDLTFKEGKITAVMGPSGLGKTTLLRILLGLEQCEGSVSGLENARVSAVFQDSRLLPWLTLRQNLELVCTAAMRPKDGGSSATERRIADALKLTELTDAAGKKPAELSGGMQRRGALARALAYDGDVFILDEPFTGLDEELKERVAGRLAARWRDQNKTVILVTHDRAEAARWADETIDLESLMRKGDAHETAL